MGWTLGSAAFEQLLDQISSSARSKYLMTQITAEQRAKAAEVAGSRIGQIARAQTEQQLNEAADAASSYIDALCDRQLITLAQWRQLLINIEAARPNWQIH